MPNLVAKEPVEDYKLTREQRAFFQAYQQMTKIQTMVKKGLQFQAKKLQGLQEIAQDIEGKKKELMLRAPQQSVLDVEDDGMIQQ